VGLFQSALKGGGGVKVIGNEIFQPKEKVLGSFPKEEEYSHKNREEGWWKVNTKVEIEEHLGVNVSMEPRLKTNKVDTKTALSVSFPGSFHNYILR
jgi:hypothetical protein